MCVGVRVRRRWWRFTRQVRDDREGDKRNWVTPGNRRAWSSCPGTWSKRGEERRERERETERIYLCIRKRKSAHALFTKSRSLENCDSDVEIDSWIMHHAFLTYQSGRKNFERSEKLRRNVAIICEEELNKSSGRGKNMILLNSLVNRNDDK